MNIYYRIKKFFINKELYRTAIHEVGHAITINLFSNYFIRFPLTLDPSIYANEINTTGMLGLNRIRINLAAITPLSLTDKLKCRDYITLICLSGMCAQTILRDKENKTKSNFSLYASNPLRRTDMGGCLDDFELIRNNSSGIFFQDYTEFNSYLNHSIIFVFNFLNNKFIWNSICKLAIQLCNKPDLTINSDGLDLFFRKINFNRNVSRNFENLLDSRFNSNITINWDNISNRFTERMIVSGIGIPINPLLIHNINQNLIRHLN